MLTHRYDFSRQTKRCDSPSGALSNSAVKLRRPKGKLVRSAKDFAFLLVAGTFSHGKELSSPAVCTVQVFLQDALLSGQKAAEAVRTAVHSKLLPWFHCGCLGFVQGADVHPQVVTIRKDSKEKCWHENQTLHSLWHRGGRQHGWWRLTEKSSCKNLMVLFLPHSVHSFFTTRVFLCTLAWIITRACPGRFVCSFSVFLVWWWHSAMLSGASLRDPNPPHVMSAPGRSEGKDIHACQVYSTVLEDLKTWKPPIGTESLCRMLSI